MVNKDVYNIFKDKLKDKPWRLLGGYIRSSRVFSCHKYI